MAENDVGSGVADEDGWDGGLVHEAGGGEVVAGEDGDFFIVAAGVAEELEGLFFGQRHWLGIVAAHVGRGMPTST